MAGNLITMKFPNRNAILSWEVMRKDQILFDIHLMEVYEHEENHDKGRFEDYSTDEQPWRIRIPVGPDNLAFQDKFTRMVGWIAQHTTGPWNLNVVMQDVFTGETIFTFSDPDVAFMFRLVFG